jgi:hypothetical protein
MTERTPAGTTASPALRVAGYRFLATLYRRWPGYVSLVVCIACLGGLAMGSIAGARRTQASYQTYIESTNPPQVELVTSILGLGPGTSGYNAAVLHTISRLPHVVTDESASGINVLPLSASGRPYTVPGFAPAAGNGLGSDDGLFFNLDKVTILSGRAPDPSNPDQVMMLQEVATVAHVHVGDSLRIGIYSNRQTQLAKFGTTAVRPLHTYVVKLVGIFELPQQLIVDDVDADNAGSLLYFTPAFTKPLLGCCSNYTETGVKVAGNSTGLILRVDAEIQNSLPKGFPPPMLLSTATTKAERSIQPESIALYVFGLIAALAALIIASQVIGRQLRRESEDRWILRALGAGRTTDLADSLLGIIASVLLGAVLAVGVAIALSPLAPIGPVRPVYPYPGVAYDWTVLGVGFALLVAILGFAAVTFAFQRAPLAVEKRKARLTYRGSAVARTAASANLSPPTVMGARFALESGGGRNGVPVRSTVIGTVLAFVVVVSTLTFGASLRSLVAHPNLYGWNWNYMLSGGGGSGDIPQPAASKLLNSDPYVGAWSSAWFDDLTIDGQTVPVLGESPGAPVQPPLLSGQLMEEPNEVVLGASTLAALDTHVGGSVVVDSPVGPPVHLRVVGTATMPAIGGPGPHLEMGIGAVLDYNLIPAADRDPFGDPVHGPEDIFVDLRPGDSDSALRHSLDAMQAPLTNNFNFGTAVVKVLRPAEIVNYRSMSSTPTFLALALCIGAVIALTLTLLSSVRRRQRDLALLKSMGFVRRQLAATIAWQSSIVVGIGALFGIPAGIVLGRYLWDLFANEINAVPAPSIPVQSVIATAVLGLALAIAVSIVPGLRASRAPTATLLRSE